MIQRCVVFGVVMTGQVALATTWTVDDDLVDQPQADFTSIQQAIDAAAEGDAINVYPGLYNEIINYGGKSLVITSITPLAAKIDATGFNGSAVSFNNEEDSSAVLDGFNVGRGSGTLTQDPIFGSVRCGGGIFIEISSPTIRNCRITSNECWGGAGMYIRFASPRVENCVFSGNVSEGHGGGIYNLEYSYAEIIGCTFEENEANWGGGMTNTIYCDPLVENCVFRSNITRNVGGGIFNRSNSNPTITNCHFLFNTQIINPLGSGGGICNYGIGNGGGPSSPTVTNCHFEGNMVNGDGGGMANAYECSPVVTNCTFVDNEAGRNGGGLACPGNLNPYHPSNAQLVDCLFEGNTADEYGGAFHSRASAPSVEGCEFRNNSAGLGGGACGFTDSPDATVAGSTFCGSQSSDFWGSFTELDGNSTQPECTDCNGDVTGDGSVNVNDILAAIGAWGICQGCPEDVNGDGQVAVDDILAILAAYGNCS